MKTLLAAVCALLGVVCRPTPVLRLLVCGVLASTLSAVEPDASTGSQPPAAGSPDDIAIRPFAEQLIALPDRGMGRPGALAALALIEARLVQAGVRCVRVPTTVSVPVVRSAWLASGGIRVPLTPLAPNRAATAGTGGAVISGRLVDVGAGQPADLDGKDLAGAVVVMDAAGGARWRACAEAGAAALIVRGVAGLERIGAAALASDASIPFPRFAADLPALSTGTTVQVQAEVAWEALTAWSLVGVIPGHGGGQEAVLLMGGYEADGPVEGHCPGATRAWNAAALVQLVERLAQQPPERSVVLVVDGARAEMFRGLRQIATALVADRGPTAVDRVAARVVAAAAAVRWAVAVAGTLAAPAATLDADLAARLEEGDRRPARDILYQILAGAAAQQADAEQALVDAARLDLAPRRRQQLAPALIAAQEAELARLMPVARAWRVFQQRLDRRMAPEAGDGERLALILPAARLVAERQRQLAQQRAADAAGLAAARALVGGLRPVHGVAIDLGDGGRRFGSITAGWFVTWKAEQNWMHRAVARLAASQQATAFDTSIDLLPGDRAAYWTDGYLHEAGHVGHLLPSLTFSTTGDARLKLGSPADTAAAFHGDAFLGQCRDLQPLLRAWIDSPELSTHRIESLELASATVRAEIRATGTTSGRRAAPFAQVWLDYWQHVGWQGDVRPSETWWCDQAGEAEVPFLPQAVPGFADGMGLGVRVYAYDGHGAIAAVPASAGLQAASGGMRLRLDGQLRDALAVLFPAVPSMLYNVVDPRLMQPLTAIGVLAATRQAAPDHAHIEVSDGDAVLWTAPDQRLLVTATQGSGPHRLLLLGEPQARGGFAGHATGLQSRLTARDAAADLWRLDEQRLSTLRRSGVEADALATLHAAAERHLAAADAALAQGRRSEAEGQALAAWAYAGRVYPGVLSAGNDVVHGLVVLLLLAVPCAWMLERLILAAATVTRRLLGFAGMFVLLFGGLFLLHPAASLATTPLIILLAVLIILMSAWVIAVLHVRFEQEMASLRQGPLGGYSADVTRLGPLIATVELGASNMRRRPLRTALTVLTVVLMTFTLLTFAGFNPGHAVRRIQLDASPSFDGVLVRRNGWAPLNNQAEDQLAARWGRDFRIVPLRWLMPNAGAQHLPVAGPAGTSPVLGLMGVAADDASGIDRALVRGAGPAAPRGLGAVPADGRDWIFLPPEVLRRCGITAGDPITWRGIDLRAGTVDARALAAAVQLGGEPATPIAEEALAGDGSAVIDHLNLPDADGAARVENASFAHQDAGAVAVVRNAVALRLGAELRAVTLVPRDASTDLEARADEMAQQLAMTLRVGRHGETWLYTAVGRLTANGLSGTLVPLALGGLIVFATMLGAVAERGREIFTYASLGLAPLHIATLFLVEAGIYAVLGALGGWLMAQLMAWTLGLAAHVGLIAAAPDLNYSSTAAMATILLVMASVLVSALYPALMAARAATPGGRRPALPAPAGDRWDVAFPVTVAVRDVRGILAFLAHWLAAAAEAGNQGFTAGEVALVEDEAGEPRLQAKVWLAPFDLGLSQTMSLEVEIIDLPGSRGLTVVLERRSGGRNDWKRANIAFLKDMRRQVLVWRTLKPEDMDLFRARGGDDAAAQRLAARKGV